MNYNLEIIRAACVKANPEIMKLKFGCNVIVKGIREDNPGCENDLVVDERELEDGKIGLGYFGRIPREAIEEVLGRPIRLADVLLAINSQFISVNSRSGDFMFDRLNEADEPYREWFYTDKKGERCVWNLRNDDLSAQSEECLAFLAGLLKESV